MVHKGMTHVHIEIGCHEVKYGQTIRKLYKGVHQESSNEGVYIRGITIGHPLEEASEQGIHSGKKRSFMLFLFHDLAYE